MNKTTTGPQVFQSDEFGAVRRLLIDGVQRYAGKNVAAALGYGRAAKAIQDHVDAEDKDEVPIRGSIGRMQKTPLFNESGLYSLILFSQLPRAREFKHWVTAEALPTIRKHGAYMADSAPEKISGNPDATDSLAERLLKERQAGNEVTALPAVAKPKADYFDAFINGPRFTAIQGVKSPDTVRQHISMRSKTAYERECAGSIGFCVGQTVSPAGAEGGRVSER